MNCNNMVMAVLLQHMAGRKEAEEVWRSGFSQGWEDWTRHYRA